MSVDTKARLKGRVYPEVIVEFLKQKYNIEATSDVELKWDRDIKEMSPEYKFNTDKKEWKTYYGYIFFTFDGEKRMLFYDYSTVNTLENLEYYSQYGLDEMVESETTYLSLGHNENAITILKDICKNFGGWLDENDCDKEEPYFIKGEFSDYTPKPIIHMTRKELNEKFNAIVIIDD